MPLNTTVELTSPILNLIDVLAIEIAQYLFICTAWDTKIHVYVPENASVQGGSGITGEGEILRDLLGIIDANGTKRAPSLDLVVVEACTRLSWLHYD